MARIKWGAWGVLILVSSVAAAAEISTLPSPGKSVGVVMADQAGKWLVMTVDRQTFYFTFPDLTLLDGGKVCVWEGSPGVYGVVFDGEDGTRKTTNVVLGSGTEPAPPSPPVVPDGLWGLTKTAYQKAMDIGLSTNVVQVTAVAFNYHDIASRISLGDIVSGADAKAALKAANQGDVPVAERQKWGEWDNAITAILSSHDADLKSNVRLIADAFNAIGAGLSLATR